MRFASDAPAARPGRTGRSVTGEPGGGDATLAEALAGPLRGDRADPGQRLTLAELSARTGVSATLLEAVARQGLLVPATDGRYGAADVEAVRAGISLLEAGVPLSELLALAREHDEATSAVAVHAVDLFARYVRDPLLANAGSEEEIAAGLVEAVEAMLPAAGTVVAHHFRRRLLAAAQARLDAAPPPDAAQDATGR